MRNGFSASEEYRIEKNLKGPDPWKQVVELRNRISELESDNARLRAALTPLVDVARDRCALDPAWKPSSLVSCLIRIDELRAAAMCLHEPCDDDL